jgi:hypothetical protein
MVRFLARRSAASTVRSALLVDDFQRVSLSRTRSCGAQKRSQSANIAALPAYNLAHIRFRHFQLDDVVIQMIHVDFIGGVNDPLRNALDEKANISSGFSHDDC